MGQAQINVRIRACSRTSIARTKQAALTHNVRGKELNSLAMHTLVAASQPRLSQKQSRSGLCSRPPELRSVDDIALNTSF